MTSDTKIDAWMRFFGDDFFAAIEMLGDTTGMKYLRCIWHYRSHTHCEGLPDDDELLRNLCRCDLTTWTRTKGLIFDNKYFFRLENGRWHQKRAREEYLETVDLVKKRSEAGKLGAAATWQPDGKRMANLMAKRKQTDGQPQPEPQPHSQQRSESTSEPEPDSLSDEIDAGNKSKTPGGKRPPTPVAPAPPPRERQRPGNPPEGASGDDVARGGSPPLAEGNLVRTANTILENKGNWFYDNCQVKAAMFDIRSLVTVLRGNETHHGYCGRLRVGEAVAAFAEAVRATHQDCVDFDSRQPITHPGAWCIKKWRKHMDERLKPATE